MLELASPPQPEVVLKISTGIADANLLSAVERYDFSIVHRKDGTIMGGLTASVSFAVLFINNIWVDASSRRRGIGSRLMAAAEAEGRRVEARTACVDTLSTQAPGFYSTLGYTEFARIEGSVDGTRVDRVWFRRTL